MNPTEAATAWEHRPTRRAWWRHLAITLAGVVGWAVALPGSLAVYVILLPTWMALIIALTMGYCGYRLLVQGVCVRDVLRIAQVLRTCPWHILYDVPRDGNERPDQGGSSMGWFEFPDPTGGSDLVPVVFSSHYRTQWWLRRLVPKPTPEQRADITPLWFSGNPWLAGVIAGPGRKDTPRRLHLVRHLPKNEQDKKAVVPPWFPLVRALEQAESARRAQAPGHAPPTPARPE
ncbi:hypothetical protein AB0J21_15985 [Streptomyces sp. NPDC049954]|uniref:hypothetical protein n=1 Tax=Streptomyces sp. NPDC049954 TaxID=3155779 RepID=UPI00343116C6